MFDWLSEVLRSGGYAGIMVLAFLDNVFPPLPSEIIIPLAGYLARRGELDVVWVVTSGSIGSIAGASFWY